jgi:hypothetical protein
MKTLTVVEACVDPVPPSTPSLRSTTVSIIVHTTSQSSLLVHLPSHSSLATKVLRRRTTPRRGRFYALGVEIDVGHVMGCTLATTQEAI